VSFAYELKRGKRAPNMGNRLQSPITSRLTSKGQVGPGNDQNAFGTPKGGREKFEKDHPKMGRGRKKK